MSRRVTAADFWERVEKRGADDCWLWTGGKYPSGYGACRGPARRAHRAAWIYAEGEIPPGAKVLHRCDVPACCNPGHLWLGTTAQNNAERAAKGRGAKRQPNRVAGNHGARSGSARVDGEMARAIYADSRSQSEIGSSFGVARATVSDIKRGLCWWRVTGAVPLFRARDRNSNAARAAALAEIGGKG